jgi:hypothetical protein
MTDIEERFTDDGDDRCISGLSFLAEPRSERESCLTTETATKVKVTDAVGAWDAA